MKKGFKLYLQKDLTTEDRKICIEYLDEFIKSTTEDIQMRYYGCVGGGYTSGLWRGRYGNEVNFYKKGLSKNITFRRLSNNVRKFGCVYSDTVR